METAHQVALTLLALEEETRAVQREVGQPHEELRASERELRPEAAW
ncbi:MAG: hypothetical protein OEM67_09195 [Thermoleophilia bacterium]|nr:hypothetical protein [Thermoleophilia bacterium]MDH3725692.1 hypothetical protein [Thermoleophilia bacterium]